jgi:hypothetical protein
VEGKEKEGRKTFKCTFMSQQKRDSHLKIISVSGCDWSVVQLQKEMKCNFTPKHSVALYTKRVSYALTVAISGGTRRYSAEGNGWSLSGG